MAFGVGRIGQRGDIDDRLDFVIRLDVQQILHRPPFGSLGILRNLEDPQPVAPPLFRKEKQMVVVGRHEHFLDKVRIAGTGTPGTFAAPVLHLVFRQAGALDVAQVRKGDDHGIVGNHILNPEIGRTGIFDLAQPFIPVLCLDFQHFVFDDLHLHGFVGQHIGQVLDLFLQFVVFLVEFLYAQTSQLSQTHIYDSLRLQFVQVETAFQSSLSIAWSA